MSVAVLNVQNCKSCGFCVRTCKQGALQITRDTNEKGYSVVGIDHEKCVGCGLCYVVCPDYVFCIEEVSG